MRAKALLPALFLTACAGTRDTLGATFDTPIPAGERRATLAITLDLDPVSDCDERFDLGVYEERGVELVTWDAERGCAGRRIVVRYVPGRVSRGALIDRIRSLSKKAEVTQG
jgi:hypothetical protein